MDTASVSKKIDGIAETVTAIHAARIDKTAAFPKESLEALRAEGLLGLMSAKEVGGMGLGLREASEVVARLAKECGSTAMVVCMHYAGAVVIEKFGPEATRKAIAKGEHLTTLAFSEAGSRSHFWAPLSTAQTNGDRVALTAKKSWVTSATHADSYVWSSKPSQGDGPVSLWIVPSKTAGLTLGAEFDGLGLRGNDSRPITAESASIDAALRLGDEGDGFKWMLELVLPYFNVMNAACSVGLMEGLVAKTIAHVTNARFSHSDSSIADLPTVRAYLARMRIKTDMAKALFLDAISAIEAGREDAVLRVLESKAACGETATEVADLAMRIAGGAAYRRELGIDRAFRDARASLVMGPTADVLFEFIGRALCRMPLF